MTRIWMILTIAVSLNLLIAAIAPARADESIVYSIYKGLDFGNEGEKPQKDFYVNVGTNNGIRAGTVLEVVRKIATYDNTNQKLYKDVAFPIAHLKVIHAEPNAAVARLDKLLSAEETPVVLPRAVMVGDSVRPTR